MRRLLLGALGVTLVALGLLAGLLGRPLSGATILAALLITAGGWLLIDATAPRTQISLDDACALMAEQQRRVEAGQ